MINLFETRLQQYAISERAVWDMYHTVSRARCLDICAHDFDETPRAKELGKLERELEPLHHELMGAWSAMWDVCRDIERINSKLSWLKATLPWDWEDAKWRARQGQPA